jgi:hypothetical protein
MSVTKFVPLVFASLSAVVSADSFASLDGLWENVPESAYSNWYPDNWILQAGTNGNGDTSDPVVSSDIVDTLPVGTGLAQAHFFLSQVNGRCVSIAPLSGTPVSVGCEDL